MEEKINIMNLPTWSWLKVNADEVQLSTHQVTGKVQAEVESTTELLPITDETIQKVEPQFTMWNNGVEANWVDTFFENRNVGYLIEGSKTEQEMFSHLIYRALDKHTADYHVLHAKEGEALNVIIRYVKGTQQDSLTRIIAEKNAKVTLIKVHEAEDCDQAVDVVTAKVAEGAEVRLISVDLAGKHLATNYYFNLEGVGAKGEMETIYLADKKQKYDFSYYMNHLEKQTESDILLNGIMEDEAEKTFRGTLDFHPGCNGSKGNELENVSLLSEKVRSKAVPILLCGEDDVEGNHAVSAGRLDEEALFYITSRGVSKEEARRMLVYAKLAPTLDKIPVKDVQRRVLERIGIEWISEEEEVK